MTARSHESLRFQDIVCAGATSGATPRVATIEAMAFGAFAPFVSAIAPDEKSFSMKFLFAGEGMRVMTGREVVGLDYLDFVDPAIKGEAFDSAFVMLSRPCGLWQVMPALTASGRLASLEYTGFPVFDERWGLAVIVSFARHSMAEIPRIVQVRHATEWLWLEIKSGAAH